MYIFVKGRLIRCFKSVVKVEENYKTIYKCFYNKTFISDTKSDLKKQISNDIEKKKEKDEYYKRY